ncbi:MAG: DUF2723 domain-containing protein, partial [Verrucomicrobia bacterium]|nr:DUF2723 domain-containing protein [Verrucomicrobiota bacterium]
MNMEMPSQPERRFVQRGLPWVIAIGGLATYLATLNHWLTLRSLAVTTEVNDWSWQPMLFQPVLFLLTRPLTWLPGSGAALALNVFSAVCASLTLALLARSVAILPHDRLEQQRVLAQNEQALLLLPSAWAPVVLATVALGLQLTFWENATAASGEMLDLLLFACPVWCLLEFRLERRRCWLDRTALFCGIAMANSWTMAGFLPLFGVALIWSNRLRFFRALLHPPPELSEWEAAAPALRSDLRFFLRMALFGLAWLSLLLLLPLVQIFSANSLLGFWQALGATAHSYRASLFFLAGTVFPRHREIALLLAAVSLVPVLVLSIRWRTFTGLERNPNWYLVAFAFYLAHVFLLLLCLWVAFDPPFSPGQISRRLGLTLLFLPLYYLGALCIGYYSGFFLLLFNEGATRPRMVQWVLCWTVPKLVYTLLGLTLVGLLVKNGPAIRATNGPALEEYARLALSVLPPQGAVLLSEDPTRLALLRAALVLEGKSGRYLPVDLNALTLQSYRAWLRRNYSKSWPEPKVEAKRPGPDGLAAPTNAPTDAATLLHLMTLLVQSNRVYYLHPGFGYLMEYFYLQPRGLLYELKLYPTNAL